MEYGMWIMLWVSALLFTISSFIWNRAILFPLLASVFWLSLAIGSQQLDFVGYGAQNIITYTHELDDWTGDIGLMYLFYGCGVTMILYSLYTALMISRDELHDNPGGHL